MSEELYKTIGLNQQPNAMQGTPLQTPGITTPELIFRTIGSAMPPPGSLRVPNRIGGLIGGTAARIAGGFSTTLADELARQRLDPLQRRMAIAGQLQQMGTAASPAGAAAQLDPNTSFSVPEPDQLPPGPPLPMQVGTPKFDQRNIPVQERIAFADLIEPLQKMETAKVEQQLKEKMRDRAGYMTAGKSIIDLDAPGGPKAIFTEADTPGDIATNLPSKIALQLATNPLTGKVDYEKAKEILQDLRTTPQGAEGRVYDYLVKKHGGDMDKVIPEYQQFVQGTALGRSQGAFTGQMNVRDTPAWKAMEEDIARLKAQGGAAGAPLPESTAKAIRSMEGVDRQLDIVEKNLDKDFLGPIRGTDTVYATRRRFGNYANSPIGQKEEAMRGALALALDDLARAKEGAVISAAMYDRLEKLLPRAVDEEGVFRNSLKRFRTEYRIALEEAKRLAVTPRGQLGFGAPPPGPPSTRAPGTPPPQRGIPKITSIEKVE